MAKRRKRNPKIGDIKVGDIATVAVLGAAAYGAVRVWPTVKAALGNPGDGDDKPSYPEGYVGPFPDVAEAKAWASSGKLGACSGHWRMFETNGNYYFECVK